MSNSTVDLFVEMLEFAKQDHTYEEWDDKICSLSFLDVVVYKCIRYIKL